MIRFLAPLGMTSREGVEMTKHKLLWAITIIRGGKDVFKNIFLALMLLSLFYRTVVSSEDDPSLAKEGDYIFRKSNLDRFIRYVHQSLQEYVKSCPQKVAMVKQLIHQKIISDMAKKGDFVIVKMW